MEIFVENLEKQTVENTNFRKVISTNAHSQLVLMNLKPMEDIGMETHDKVDQFFRIEEGVGKAVLNGTEYKFSAGFGIVIPAGTEHNIINTSTTEQLKVYTIYSPANHPNGTIHVTKEEAIKAGD
ncbi:MAG: cupin domain-containing protein [Patescibacteria group bacterium]|nr:cupin domain-containing protein [Patescibacteria group bacterium]MBU1952824.1 cupin domain-containing protein [Patescibacteria group bacterium]